MSTEHDKIEETIQEAKELTNEEGCSLTEGKVRRMVEEFEGKINESMLLNLKYVDQSFYMKREMRLQEKKTKKK